MVAPPAGRPYVYYWLYEELARPAIALSDATKIRLDPEANCVRLKDAYNSYTGRHVYPLDSDIAVSSWYWRPAAVRQWTGFEELSVKPTGTEIGHVLETSSGTYYWNGAAWASWDSATWNTEAEIADHMSTFPVADRELKVVSRLKTTDKFATPRLYGVRVSAVLDSHFLDDLFHRTLVPLLKSQFHFHRDHVVRLPGADSYVELTEDHAPEAALEIVGVAEAYNETDDPEHMVNIFSGYNPSTKRVTFTGAQGAGDLVWIELYVQPVIGVAPPRQDYYEVERVPAIMIEGVDVDGDVVHARRVIKDKANGTALVLDRPYQADIDFTLRLLAADATSIERMRDAGFAFVQANPTILSAGYGEHYNLTMAGRAVSTTSPSLEDLFSVSLPMRIEKAYFWPSSDSRYLVQTFVPTIKGRDGGEPIGVSFKR
jgi:hypothetical protein